MAQMNFRISDEQKERWEAFIEEDGRYNSVSELVRSSVESNIRQESDDNRDEEVLKSIEYEYDLILSALEMIDRMTEDILNNMVTQEEFEVYTSAAEAREEDMLELLEAIYEDSQEDE